MNQHKLLIGDVRERLRELPDGQFHVVVTSPPYWGLRDYGVAGQIGSEPTPDEHIAVLVDVFREVKRVLRDDGCCWLNYGESYSSTPPGCKGVSGSSGLNGIAGDSYRTRLEDGHGTKRDTSRVGVPAGNQLLLPHRLALALQADGWCVRSTVVWSKVNPMPESINGVRWTKCRVKVAKGQYYPAERTGHPGRTEGERVCPSGGLSGPNGHESQAEWTDCPGCDKCRDNGGYVLRRGAWRCTTAHEYVFQLTKGMEYFCDAEAAKERAICADLDRESKKRGSFNGKGEYPIGREPFRAIVPSRNPRTVWTLSTEPTGSFETDLWSRVEVGDVSCGMMHIPSPGCPVHGDSAGLGTKLACGESQADTSNHTERTYGHRVQGQCGEPCNTQPSGGDCSLVDRRDVSPQRFSPTGTQNDSGSNKTGLAPGTSPSCMPCAQTACRTESIPVSLASSGQCRGISESNILPDEMDARLRDQTAFRIAGTFSLPVSPLCTCSFYRKTTKTTSHFATFPGKLVYRCLLPSVSKAGCCAECGSQYAPVVERERNKPAAPSGNREIQRWNQDTDASALGGRCASRTLAYRPTCTCGAASVPCRVCDPFAGSGTTLAVALAMGCDATGIELNAEYAAIAERRIARGWTLPDREKPKHKPANAQAVLFE